MCSKSGDIDLTVRENRYLTSPSVRLQEGDILFEFMNICRGVAYLHECKILHHDIQSTNILMPRLAWDSFKHHSLANLEAKCCYYYHEPCSILDRNGVVINSFEALGYLKSVAESGNSAAMYNILLEKLFGMVVMVSKKLNLSKCQSFDDTNEHFGLCPMHNVQINKYIELKDLLETQRTRSNNSSQTPGREITARTLSKKRNRDDTQIVEPRIQDRRTEKISQVLVNSTRSTGGKRLLYRMCLPLRYLMISYVERTDKYNIHGWWEWDNGTSTNVTFFILDLHQQELLDQELHGDQ
ncbi:hypothetical protein RCL_jg20367.t1 [Rhizophagus clarus]|uniref:Protein kinase domain-containing protein n=1 Tax=Rhizophagus clarus TaxID=94130 RepID=A0A8H3QEH6_9GLOM|nr:hypothetical protein RCL_jg20367.t1 [Rhizophagus clarus]